MTTRAIQIGFLISGLTDPNTAALVSGGSVEFYEAGTTTPKSVWSEKEKTNAYTSYDLDSIGTTQLYAEGNYKVVVKNSMGVTVKTLDNIRLEYPYYGIRSVISTGNQLSQDDFLLVNTTSGAVTINALAASSWTRPLKIQRIAGSNAITFDPSGAETIDGAATLVWSSGAIVEIISDGSNLRSAGFRSSFADADNDTKIQVEESADEDKIRFDTGGTERAVIDEFGLHAVLADADGDTKIQAEESADEDKVRIDIATVEKALFSGTATESYIQVNSHQDADGDTKIQVEEGADDDIVRIDAGGTEKVQVTATGTKIIDNAVVGATGAIDSNRLIQVVGSVGAAYIEQADSQGASRKRFTVGLQGSDRGIVIARDEGGAVHLPIDYYATTHAFTGDGAFSGTLSAGGHELLPISSALRDTASGLTITGSLLEVVDLDMGTVTAGDIFIACAYVRADKGASSGNNVVEIIKDSGTAVLEGPSGSTAHDITYGILSSAWATTLTAVFRVTTGGTLVLKVDAASANANSTNGSATLKIEWLRKA